MEVQQDSVGFVIKLEANKREKGKLAAIIIEIRQKRTKQLKTKWVQRREF